MLSFRKTEPDLAQVESVRILSQPIEEFRLSFRTGVVTNLSSVRFIESGTQRLRLERRWKRSRVPTPLRHRAERHCIGIDSRKSL